MTLKAEKFEELLTRELAAELEPQRGKALAAFRAHVAEERPAIAGKVTGTAGGRQISQFETWFWASVPSLVAACLAVVVTLKLMGPGGGSSVVPPQGQSGMITGPGGGGAERPRGIQMNAPNDTPSVLVDDKTIIPMTQPENREPK